MALKAVKGTFERMLDKNLQDLVRGIRNHKDDEAKYITECLEEIKAELKVDNLAAKANAINKLIYLQMLGNNISWAAFNIIEVMSSPKFTYKRIGYLAASQSFHDQTDVLMLTTNLIRKDLNSPHFYETGVALSGLSCFLTTDIARDLAGDIMTLMNSTKPYIRKKAVLLMYKVFLKFPDALRPAFPRLKEKLEDPDPGVQSAAVNVICELARKNPKNYLSLAPLFFKLMNSSNNNWVLIKIIKLFGALTPLEPRLGKKLIEPLTNLIHSTSAMSLLYECINTVIAGIPNHSASIQLCVQKLRILIEDSDQNLKYLGLLAMTKILKSHPKSVQTHKDLILNCLDDKDESIRLRALDLLYGMISKKNIMEIVKKLMTHMDKAEGSHYRNELLVKIIEITSQDNYHYITNFEWYVTILIELTRIEGIKNVELIAAQLLDVAIRVPTVRDFTVKQMANLLHTSGDLLTNAKQSGVCEIVYAAAWICGEYAEYLSNPKKTLDSMLHSSVGSLPGHIQSVLVQNTLKLYCHLLTKFETEHQSENDVPSQESCIELTQLVLDKMALLVHSADLEVQERAVSSHQLLRYILKQQQKNISCNCEVSALFGGEINPVTSKAQRRVPIPEGLDLDAWINEPPAPVQSKVSDSEDNDEDISKANLKKKKKKHSKGSSKSKNNYLFVNSDTASDRTDKIEITEEEIEQMRQARLREQESNPHYLKDTGIVESSNGYINLGTSEDVPPVEPLENVVGVDAVKRLTDSNTLFPSSDYYLRKHKSELERSAVKAREKKKKKHKKSDGRKIKTEELDCDDEITHHIVKSEFDVPEGAMLDNDDRSSIDLNDPHRFLNIDLDKPLTEEEKLSNKQHSKKTEQASKKENRRSKPKSSNIGETVDTKKLSKPNKEQEQTEKTNKDRKSKKDKRRKTAVKQVNEEVIVETDKKDEPIIAGDDTFSKWLDCEPQQKIIDEKQQTKNKSNCLSNLSPRKIDSVEFTNLLTLGTLVGKSSVKIKRNIRIDNFKEFVQIICKECHFFVVEEIQTTVSMYSRSRKENGGAHICLLIKLTNDGSCVTVEAKSDNEQLVHDVTKSLKHIIRNRFKSNELSSS